MTRRLSKREQIEKSMQEVLESVKVGTDQLRAYVYEAPSGRRAPFAVYALLASSFPGELSPNPGLAPFYEYLVNVHHPDAQQAARLADEAALALAEINMRIEFLPLAKLDEGGYVASMSASVWVQ